MLKWIKRFEEFKVRRIDVKKNKHPNLPAQKFNNCINSNPKEIEIYVD